MEALKNTVTVISVLMVIYGVISLLLPYESMSKSIKYVAVLSLIVSVCNALKGFDITELFQEIKVDEYQSKSNDFEQTVQNSEIAVTQAAIVKLVEDRCREIGEPNVNCEAFADISEDNCIIITEVNVYCEAGSSSRIKAALEGFGLEVNVIENGG